MRVSPWLVIVVVACACTGEEPAHAPTTDLDAAPQVLMRRDVEPKGTNCQHGGSALRAGRDDNRDGVLTDSEVESTTYICHPSTALKIRRDALTASLECPAGGAAVLSGVDDDDNGVLDDAEIDQTTRVCSPLELWDGDFPASSWADPIKVAALQGAHVVTGSIEINTPVEVDLPLLELVTGNLIFDSSARGDVSMPALTTVGGRVWEGGALRELHLDALTTVGGELVLGDRSLVSLPALRSVGGDYFGGGSSSTVNLAALRTIGGHLFAGGAQSTFALPALETVDGDLRIGDAITELRLDRLDRLGGNLTLDQGGGPLRKMTSVSLPALTRINGNVSIRDLNWLSSIDLRALDEVRGTFMLSHLPALVDFQVWHLRQVTATDFNGMSVSIWDTGLTTLDLSSLAVTTGGIHTSGNASLREVFLHSLSSATTLLFIAPRLENVVAPRITSLDVLILESEHTLHNIDFGALTLIRSMFLDDNALPDLSGFHSLVSVGFLSIMHDTQLRDLRGLSSLQRLSRLEIRENPALTSLDGLERVTELTGTIWIDSNDALTNVSGLGNVTSIGESLQISTSRGLTSLALPGLQTVGDDFSVVFAPLITGVNFPSLTSIGGGLRINRFPALTSLSGFDALMSVQGRVEASELPNVPDAEIAAFLHRL